MVKILLRQNKIINIIKKQAIIFLILILVLFILACKKKNVMPFAPSLGTSTFTGTPTVTGTFTPTGSFTQTFTPSFTGTDTPLETFTFTPTVTNTSIPANAYGGYDVDYAMGIAKTADGGYMVAGLTRSYGAGGADAYLVKIDSAGFHKWEKFYGDAGDEIFNDIISVYDGNFVAVGSTTSFGSGYLDAYIMKVDATGNCIWSKSVGGADYDFFDAVIEAADRSIFAAGATRSFGTGNYDFYLVKFDKDWNLNWQKNYNRTGSSLDQAHSIAYSSDGGFLLGGESSSYYYLIKTDFNGAKQWEIHNIDFGYSTIRCIKRTPDNGYILTGEKKILGTNYDLFLTKINASGSEVWSYNFGGPYFDTGRRIEVLSDGYLIAGELGMPTIGDTQCYLVRTDINGGLLWQKDYGGALFDTAYGLVRADDNGYVFAGRTFSFGFGSPGDMLILKTDASGNLQW